MNTGDQSVSRIAPGYIGRCSDRRTRGGRYADHVLEVPTTHPQLTPVLAIVQLQLGSDWVANRLGRSIDKSGNLAQSVTVE